MLVALCVFALTCAKSHLTADSGDWVSIDDVFHTTDYGNIGNGAGQIRHVSVGTGNGQISVTIDLSGDAKVVLRFRSNDIGHGDMEFGKHLSELIATASATYSGDSFSVAPNPDLSISTEPSSYLRLIKEPESRAVYNIKFLTPMYRGGVYGSGHLTIHGDLGHVDLGE